MILLVTEDYKLIPDKESGCEQAHGKGHHYVVYRWQRI
jgi:hypothetical protein